MGGHHQESSCQIVENFINQEIPCQTVGDFKIGGWSLRSPFFSGDTNEPIIRITSQSSSGELELKGTLKLSNMIPVPASELILYDMEHEPDLFYKSLIHKEMLFIRKNKNKIIQNAKILYKQKKENKPAIGYLKSTVDFSLLEQMHDKFIEKKKN